MNVKNENKNRIVGICILLMMAALAAVTVVLGITANAWDENDSYSLVVKKKFAFNENIPEEVRVAAQDPKQEYKFKVTGTVRDADGSRTEIDEEITLPRTDENGTTIWESEVYHYGGPFDVTVTELTDNVDITDKDGNHYNMSDSFTNTSLTVDSRKHEVQLRNNGTLDIKRPEGETDPEVLWYQVTSSAYDEHPTESFVPMNQIFSLKAGEGKSFTGLKAAVYTIEQIAAPDGYQIQMGTRHATVEKGKTGHFHINGTPGKLTLTAGGKKGDGALHYFSVERTEVEEGDTSKFVTRRVEIASGESSRLDDLPKGGYTVKEYSFTEEAGTEFSVETPQTEEKVRSERSSAPQYENFRTFSLTEGTTYIKLVSFGPFYNANKKKLTSNITYNFDYGVGNENGSIMYRSVSGTKEGKKTYTMNNASAFYPKTPKIGFRTRNVSSTAAKYIGVSWTEYFVDEITNTFEKAGVQYNTGITVDDRGWMTISAPAAKGSNSNQVVYYYILRNSENQLITGAGGTTDRADTTVKLRAGESVKLTGLAAGSYKITEDVKWDHIGFTMDIEGEPFGTTEADTPIEVEVGGERDIKISKPALGNSPGNSDDTRNYTFRVSGNGFDKNITIKNGESGTLTLPADGKYTVTPQKDVLGNYELKYTDSGAIYGTASGHNGVVTFTNVYNRGEFGYRYVHEYYIREADGSYTYEGNGQITTRLGRDDGETYQALDISQAPEFNGNHYNHFSEAYGSVTPISARAVSQADTEEVFREDPLEPADSGEPEPPDESLPEPADGGEPEPSDESLPEPADGGEPEPSDESLPEPADSGEPESSEEKILKPADGEEPVPPEDETSKLSEDADPALTEEKTSESAASGEVKRLKENPPGSKEKQQKEIGYDKDGIVNKGTGLDFAKATLNYETDSRKEGIAVTKDASQIIILRYYRDRQPEGKYNVIHVYYRRDENGDHWEGVSGVLPRDGELGIKYNGYTSVDKVYNFQPEGEARPCIYTWDGRPQYGVVDQMGSAGDVSPEENEFAGNGWVYRPNNSWTEIEGTEEGNQIIILRYYREPGREGRYNIVHEYYFRENGESLDSEADEIGYRSVRQGVDDSSGTDEEDTADIFNGTLLNRNDGFVYTFEGKTEIEPAAAPLGATRTAREDDWKLTYEGNKYTYLDAGYGTTAASESYSYDSEQQWAASTENGDQIIILRYYRDENSETPSDASYKVVHEYYVRDSAGAETMVGTSDIREVKDADIHVKYTERDVSREPVFEEDTYTYFECGYGKVSGQDYSEVSGKDSVRATESGREIIILRYVREEKHPTPPKDGGPPETGDDHLMILWGILAVCSLCEIILCLNWRKRMKYIWR